MKFIPYLMIDDLIVSFAWGFLRAPWWRHNLNLFLWLAFRALWLPLWQWYMFYTVRDLRKI